MFPAQHRRGFHRRDVLRAGALAAGAAAVAGAGGVPFFDPTRAEAASAGNLQALQQSWVDLRFGMFIHFNMGTFHDAEWVDPGQDPKSFNPTRMDCDQWATAAKSAGMKFAALTMKHHDGFCLWPTKQTSYNVMNSSYPHDIVRLFVDAFRAQGIAPCVYFSIWDRQHGIQAGSVSHADIDFIKAQLSELLGGTYGTFPALIIDGWAWQTGHREVPYGEIRDHVKSLQPNILIVDHNGQTEPWEEDLIYFEEPLKIWAPTTNTYASLQGQNIVNTGWFWHPATPTAAPRTVSDIVTTHLKALEPRYCNFILNCPPNTQGLLDTNIVNRLRDVGASWTPNTTRPALPTQPDILQHVVTPISAYATSGTAANAIDGHLAQWSDATASQTLWQSTGSLPQSVTADLGGIYTNLDALFYLPRGKDTTGAIVTTGNITGYRVLVSSDNSAFTQVASGTWTADEKIKRVRFGPVAAQWVRLEATSAHNASYAVISEFDVGGIAAKPTVAGGGTGTAWATLANRNSGRVADVNGSSTADGAAVVQWPSTGNSNQQWQIVDAGGGYSKLVNRNSGKVLEVTAKSTAESAPVEQWTDNGGANQQWQIVDAGGGYSKLVNRRSGKLLTASGADGTPLVQSSDAGTSTQQWRISSS